MTTPSQMRELLRSSAIAGVSLHESIVVWATEPVACDDMLVVFSNVASNISGKRSTDLQTRETVLDHFDTVQVRIEAHEALVAQELANNLRIWFSHESTQVALRDAGVSVLSPPGPLTYAGYYAEDLWVDAAIFELSIHYVEIVVDLNLIVYPAQRVVASGTLNSAEFTATSQKV